MSLTYRFSLFVLREVTSPSRRTYSDLLLNSTRIPRRFHSDDLFLGVRRTHIFTILDPKSFGVSTGNTRENLVVEGNSFRESSGRRL